MTVRAVTTSTFRQEVLESDVPVVVDFYADWCAPCRMVSPAVEALAREWEGSVAFAKVDIDRHPRLAQAYRVSSIPAVLVFEGGEVRGWSVGAKPGYLIERELRLKKRASKPPRSNQDGGRLGRARKWLGAG